MTFVRIMQFKNRNIWQVCTNVLILCVGRNDSKEQCPYRPKPYAKYGSCSTFLCSQTQIYNLSFPLVLFSISELVSDAGDGGAPGVAAVGVGSSSTCCSCTSPSHLTHGFLWPSNHCAVSPDGYNAAVFYAWEYKKTLKHH